jgi:hypothetical protein
MMGSLSGGAVVLVAVVVLGAGCASNAVNPSAGSSATSTSTSTSTGAAPPASRPPAPSARPDPAAAAIDGFVTLVTKKGFSYQATFSGQDRHSTTIVPLKQGLLQVAGDDVLVRVTFAPPGQAIVVEHRSVGGKAWVKYDGAAWHRVALPPADTMAAFAAVRTAADVTSLGPVKADGKTYYQVSFRSAIMHPMLIPAGNLTETALTTPKLTLLLDPTGRPVKGTAEIDGKGRVSGQLQEIVIELSVTFTKVGQPVTIKAP